MTFIFYKKSGDRVYFAVGAYGSDPSRLVPK